jgi:hypothetical protein
MPEHPADNPPSVIDLGRITAEGVHINIAPVVIATTEDKLKLALHERQRIFRSREAWIAPLGILLSIVTTLLTTDFRMFLLAAAVWEAIFFISAIAAFLWLIYTLWQCSKSQSIDEFIHYIKRTE